MRITILFLSLLTAPLFMFGQIDSTQSKARLPKHYISVNPLNIFLFQQAGITYEYKSGVMGYEITTGYIYPNHKDYSNYFIAGPTDLGSLGDYSGFFIVPQVNVYLRKPKNPKHGGLVYLSLKMVYKYMQIDSTRSTVWDNAGDPDYLYRNMIDKVNIFGGFVDFGYRYVLYHFFFDFNFGFGGLRVTHNMIIAKETLDNQQMPYNPPLRDKTQEDHLTINFSLNFGGAF